MLDALHPGKIENIATRSRTLHAAAYWVYTKGGQHFHEEVDVVVESLVKNLEAGTCTVEELQTVAWWMRDLREEAGAIGWDVLEPAGCALEYLARGIGCIAAFEALTLTGNRFGQPQHRAGGAAQSPQLPENSALINAVMAA